MKRSLVIVLLLFSTPALAQQSPEQQALSEKLIEEINMELRLRAQVIGLQEQVKQLQTELEKARAPAEIPK